MIKGNNNIVKNQSEEAIAEYTAKDGNDYLLMKATRYHSDSITKLFKDAYGWNYGYPYVYTEELGDKIEDANQFWYVFIKKEENEVVGVGVLERKGFTLHGGRGIIKSGYRRLGLGTRFGSSTLGHIMKMPPFRSLKRFNGGARAKVIAAHKYVEYAGATPYAIIPNRVIFGDKRGYALSNDYPFDEGRIEAVIQYAIYFNNFWKYRNKKIFLYPDKDISFHYNYALNNNRQMKNDTLTTTSEVSFKYDHYLFEVDPYNSFIIIKGYLNQKTLKDILAKYHKWNTIEWRIPATQKGIYSQKLALEEGFIIAGYKLGALSFSQFDDVIKFCKFPNGIDDSQFEEVNFTPLGEKLFTKVKGSLPKKKRKKKANWVLYCKECDYKEYRIRKSKVIKHPEQYTCPNCNNRLYSKKFEN
jgi:hypothetical protein